MVEIQRIPDIYKIKVTNGEPTDSKVEFEVKQDRVSVYITATNDRPEFITMRWLAKQDKPVKILSDGWERLSSDTAFGSLNAEKSLPWYFIINDGEKTDGCGVAVRPNSFVCFSCDGEGVTGWFDIRCGAMGVELGGRRLHVADIICRHYEGISSFDALYLYCKELCTDPILPEGPIFGGNNWYYAYGKSSPEEILDDARLQVEFAAKCNAKPFMVIDDCWEINQCCGPWLPNEKFSDMKGLAQKMKDLGVRPGIWTRFLNNNQTFEQHPEYRIQKPGRPDCRLDPSRPEVLDIIREDILRIKEWGFELIKHDFSSYDMFDRFGFDMFGTVTADNDWTFYDKTKTSAEIVLNFYRTILDACGDMLIIGCETFSHLCAGLVHINRTGDDTSGRNWDRSRAFGVNSLAFRLAQHNAFYAVDADCAGFVGDKIPWKFNKQWIDLLAKSKTPLFISCPKGLLPNDQIDFIQNAFKQFCEEDKKLIPLDFEYNAHPRLWQWGDQKLEYSWTDNDHIPEFCFNRRYQLH